MTKESEFHLRMPPAHISQSQQPIVFESLDEYPYKSVAMGTTRANLTGLWRYWRPYFQTKRAPCDAACPVGNHVVDFIQTLLDGHWPEAANILRAENPLPGITGRICHRPCERACNRRQYDERIAIHDIEAVLAEAAYVPLDFPCIEATRAIAVVGSGPAELAFAHFGALLGHQVTLYEEADGLGGRLRHGSQARHLPDGLLDAEIERIVAGRIEVRQQAAALAELATGYDVVFGALGSAEHLTLHISSRGGNDAGLPELLAGEGDPRTASIPISLRVSEAIGYGKWAALLLDADWRGLDAAAVLAQIQMGGNARIVSALKYLALLTEHGIERTEEVVSYDKLETDLMAEPRAIEPAQVEQAGQFVTSVFFTADDLQHVLHETARCFSCGRCNGCDNCWIFCPDGVISRKDGIYAIDYDYCKGCSVCTAVCPRGVISVIEEEKWSG
jgi:2-oxoacid:acceptor oxidoreductase delta subunit (pyruvate/2-ketoisovalerate family)